MKFTLTDTIGPTETTVYRIGCPPPPADPTNYAADPGFEGGLATHPMPAPAGIPGYNLDDQYVQADRSLSKTERLTLSLYMPARFNLVPHSRWRMASMGLDRTLPW